MSHVRDALVGKTITGVITRPGRDGLPELLVLALEDGSYMQFVMPERRRRGRYASAPRAALSEPPESVVAAQTDGAGSEQLPLIHTACG